MTGDMPKWQRDLADIALVGAEISIYMNLRSLLAQVEHSEDMRATQLFNVLDLLATIIRNQNKDYFA